MTIALPVLPLTFGVIVILHVPFGAVTLQLIVAPTRLHVPVRLVEPLAALMV